MKKIYTSLSAMAIMASTAFFLHGCVKSDLISENYLQLDYGVINITNTKGAHHEFSIQSNIKWHLSISPATTDWIVLSKSNGSGNGNIIVTAAKDNLEQMPKTAQIIATAPENPLVKPVYLMAIQNDSTVSKF